MTLVQVRDYLYELVALVEDYAVGDLLDAIADRAPLAADAVNRAIGEQQ